MSTADCPKHMTYGPWGGVRPDGRCEVGQPDCPFISGPLPAWRRPAQNPGLGADPHVRALALRASLARGGAVIADFPARALDARSLVQCAAALGDVDAVLLGDSPRHRVQFPPSYRAALLQSAGLTPWVGLNARDRNRVALEGEFAALADLRVGAVHCVTGDHPASSRTPGIEERAFERIVAAPDPRRAGIEAAVELGRRMLDTGLVAGINLSGGPEDGEELTYAEGLAEVADGLRR